MKTITTLFCFFLNSTIVFGSLLSEEEHKTPLSSATHENLENIIAHKVANAPVVSADDIESFMQPRAKEGFISFRDPVAPQDEYLWTLSWHAPFPDKFHKHYPAQTFNYSVSLVDERGLGVEHCGEHFASYRIFVTHKETKELIDPWLVFYLKAPQLIKN